MYLKNKPEKERAKYKKVQPKIRKTERERERDRRV
jgi:hypothetical protein